MSTVLFCLILRNRKIFFRVNINSVYSDFKMKMSSGGISCWTDFPNRVSGFNFLPLFHIHLAAMGITSLNSVTVVDYHMISVTGITHFNLNNCSVCGGKNFAFVSVFTGDIDSGMAFIWPKLAGNISAFGRPDKIDIGFGIIITAYMRFCGYVRFFTFKYQIIKVFNFNGNFFKIRVNS